MNRIGLGVRTRTLYVCLWLSIVLAGCGQPVLATPVAVASPEIIHPAITAEVAARPATVSAATATAGEPSFLSFPSVGGDAGNFSLLAGETIPITWEHAPLGADRYEFNLVPIDHSPTVVVGIDTDASDGVAVTWQVTAHVAAELHATAYFPGDRTIDVSFAPTVYSGDLPPAGVCSLLARNQPVEVYRQPDRTAEIFALLYPAVYARVLEAAPDGWYRIDASVAEVYTRPLTNSPDTGFQDVPVSLVINPGLSPASGEGWVNSDRGVLLVGACPPGGG
jgi:hypothetical protein